MWMNGLYVSDLKMILFFDQVINIWIDQRIAECRSWTTSLQELKPTFAPKLEHSNPQV